MNLAKMIFDNAKHYFSDYLEKFNISDFRIFQQENENENANAIDVVFVGNDVDIDVDITCTYSNTTGIVDDTYLLIIVHYLDNGFEKLVGISLHQVDFV